MNPILINGLRQAAHSTGSFQAIDPTTSAAVGERFPVSQWDDCEAAMSSAQAASIAMEEVSAKRVAEFLNRYAKNLERHSAAICEMANRETGLPIRPRLIEVEMPRTIDQLKQAAMACLNDDWRQPVHDHERNIHSCLGPIGPVLVFGPNNFPLAFNAISGGDFAAAIAAGNPVIAKAHPNQPGTSRLLAEQAHNAALGADLPAGMVQLLYHMAPEDGLSMVSDPRIGAVAFTGSRSAGSSLKAAADTVGKPIYLEMSSINPVFLLTSAVSHRKELVEETAGSCLIGSGQFCTCPNLIVLQPGPLAQEFLSDLTVAFESKPVGTLLSSGVEQSMVAGIKQLTDAGAEVLFGGEVVEGEGCRFTNTLLRVAASTFLQNPVALQTEVFGPASLVVVCDSDAELPAVADSIQGSLTAVVYGDLQDPIMHWLTRVLRRKAGRVLHNKMPTGVAVSPAMNHGGPYPATGHPRFTAVGIPASLQRFTKLDCFDNVAEGFLPECLKGNHDQQDDQST